MGERCAAACREIGYRGAGTFEFLYQDGEFYFIEMNTRVQVEHPVTELVTGVDIVVEQLRIAAGEPLSLTQSDVHVRGHALECRINAEDPENDFAASLGTIQELHLPGGPGIRVDTHLERGYVVQPFYDSLLAKVIAHGSDREEALARMDRALNEMQIRGVHTTVDFHRRLLETGEFRRGEIHTTFVEAWMSGSALEA